LSNLILADHEGHVVEGDHAINQAGFVLHGAAHKMHPDIVAMCHAHTEYGTTFAALGKPLAPISQDACAFFEDHAVVLEEAGQVAVEKDAGFNVCQSLGGVKAVIHQSHGLLSLSRHSIEAAAFWFSAVNISVGCTSRPYTRNWWRPTQICSTDRKKTLHRGARKGRRENRINNSERPDQGAAFAAPFLFSRVF
jgi:ribulose-5-phosphate 4-epimerase/fuculose-1-phosphate aldolase